MYNPRLLLYNSAAGSKWHPPARAHTTSHSKCHSGWPQADPGARDQALPLTPNMCPARDVKQGRLQPPRSFILWQEFLDGPYLTKHRALNARSPASVCACALTPTEHFC